MSNFLPVVKLEFINDKQVPAVTSQQLAEVFGKEHYNVLRDIRETVAKCSKSFCALNFEGAEYLDEQGKSRPYPAMWRGRMSSTCHPLRVSICCREIKERVHGQMDD